MYSARNRSSLEEPNDVNTVCSCVTRFIENLQFLTFTTEWNCPVKFREGLEVINSWIFYKKVRGFKFWFYVMPASYFVPCMAN